MFNLFKKLNPICHHDFCVIETTNIYQLDDMGYPLLLCLERCTKCGKTNQRWIDCSTAVMNDENYHKCVWIKSSKVPL